MARLRNIFSVVDVSAVNALREWAWQREMRGKGAAGTAQRFMGYWVMNAMNNIPKGDRARIEAYLLTETARARYVPPVKATKKAARAAELANRYRHTIAARIVAAFNIYGARGNKPEEFYQKVHRWVQRRKFAANLHRAGLLPASRLLRLRNRRGEMPRLQHAPGQYTEQITDDLVELFAENWASQKELPGHPAPKGITGLAGDAFDKGLEETLRNVTKFVMIDMLKAARRAGFQLNTAAA